MSDIHLALVKEGSSNQIPTRLINLQGMSVNRGTKRTYHQISDEPSSLPRYEEEYHHYNSSSMLSMSSSSSHIQLVRDPLFIDVPANSQSRRSLSDRVIRLGKSQHSSVQFEDLKRLRVFYKVFEVVNKLSISLGDENAANDSELLRKREMVSKLLKSFSEAHISASK